MKHGSSKLHTLKWAKKTKMKENLGKHTDLQYYDTQI